MNNDIVEKAINSLGKGFDLTSDFRLKYCKGDQRLVLVNETDKRDIVIPCCGDSIKDVSVDIRCDKGDRTRFQTDILDFNKMSEFFNRKAGVPGKIPSGYFNSMFGFQSGSWAIDAGNVKNLGMDGYFITLFNLHLRRYPLELCNEVRNDVPSFWDPAALARFIEKYGTHVIVGLSIGGQDVVLVKQEKSSELASEDLRKHLHQLSTELFTETCNYTPITKFHKAKAPKAFNVFDDPLNVTFGNFSINSKDGLTVLCSKRGGDPLAKSHSEWLQTVGSKADAVHFNFIPITSLINGLPGKGFLSHAINLYLRYKPPLADLQHFLAFQSEKIWAPVHNDLPLGTAPNMRAASPSLQFNLMGPKMYVNTTQVTSSKTPVTGMRLYLEGMKCNRLAIHLQHLSTTPPMLESNIDDIQFWQGTEDVPDSGYIEPVNGKRFSHICTAPVKYNPDWSSGNKDSAFIVTGAQLSVKKHGSIKVLHLTLLYSKVTGHYVVQKHWARGPSQYSQKSGIFSALTMSLSGGSPKEKEEMINLDSGVFQGGPPVPVQTQKFLKFVDVSEICKGPRDSPGHWLVTGARLYLEKGKIFLHVKFSLLNKW